MVAANVEPNADRFKPSGAEPTRIVTYVLRDLSSDYQSDRFRWKTKGFKFSLKPGEKKSFGRVVELPHNRLIPTSVKVEV